MDLDSSQIEYSWDARSVRPVVLLYVVAVFIAFIVLAFFVFHSVEAVQALFLTGIGAVAGTTPSLLGRIEYQLTETGLEKRRRNEKQPKEFKRSFTWDELSYVRPTKTGYKFYKDLSESGSVRRFLQLHLTEGPSGEFHVEVEDRGQVRAVIDRHGVPTSKPTQGPSLPQHPKSHG